MKKSKVDTNALPNETWDDYVVRTALEAKKESEELGYFSSEQAEAIMTKHKHEFFKKSQKSALEEAQDAIDVKARHNEKRTSLAEVRKELGL